MDEEGKGKNDDYKRERERWGGGGVFTVGTGGCSDRLSGTVKGQKFCHASDTIEYSTVQKILFYSVGQSV
jgi:hypothetical protein